MRQSVPDTAERTRWRLAECTRARWHPRRLLGRTLRGNSGSVIHVSVLSQVILVVTRNESVLSQVCSHISPGTMTLAFVSVVPR